MRITVSDKTEKKYRELFALQEREGLSRDEIARRAGVKPGTVTWWRCEIARRDRERMLRGVDVDAVVVRTDRPYTEALLRFFRMREHRH